MTPEEEKNQAAALNDEIAALLGSLNKAHREWLKPRMGSGSTRVSTYVALRIMLRAFNLNDMTESLRAAADRLADNVELKTAPASEVLSNFSKTFKA